MHLLIVMCTKKFYNNNVFVSWKKYTKTKLVTVQGFYDLKKEVQHIYDFAKKCIQLI